MKILLLGAFDKGALEHHFVNGLRMVDAEVHCYDITRDYYSSISSLPNKVINKLAPAVFFRPINNKLLGYIRNKYFDVILIFKGLALFPETITQLKKYTRLLCCYNGDHPFKFFSEGSGNKNIRNSIRLYDIYITYSQRIAAELKSKYHVQAEVVPFGYDDMGILPKPASALSSSFTNYWLLIAAYDKERAAFINKLGNDNVTIYGDDKWRKRTNNSDIIQASFQDRFLYDDEYKLAIQEGRGVFNLLRQQNIEEQSHNMRSFEVPGYGGLLIANRTEEQLTFFKEDKEAIYFDSAEELKDKLGYLERHPEQISRIKQAARERSQRAGYGYSYRSAALYKIFSNALHTI